jgi:Uncharacterized protein conserved in bacteria
VLVGPVPTDGGNKLQPLDLWGHDCLWWLDRMVRSRNQLVERMTLNLHDLFATSNAGVGNTRHMLRQNRLLRGHAVGNFHDLLERITIDPAMLLWLNGADSNKWEPNENYGREVMELFCLGNDPNLESLTHGLWTNANMYTQNDIHEAARALTGWRYDWNKAATGTIKQRENPTFWDAGYHDTGQRRSTATRGTGTGATSAGWWCTIPTTRPTWPTRCGATSSRHRRRRRPCARWSTTTGTRASSWRRF